MEHMPKGLLMWNDMLGRHDLVVFLWNMKGEDGYPYLEYVSENVCKYGYMAEEFLDNEIDWMALVSEVDRNRVDQQACNFLLRASENLCQQYRVVTKMGETLWVEADSCYIRGESGENTYVETVIRDITESKNREWALLKNQEMLQNEIFSYMESRVEKDFKEALIDLLKEQKIEVLQAAFCDIYGIHAAIIGRDYYFYTHMTGPKEEEGIFYDVAELGSFRKKISRLEEILDSGQRNVILSMNSPGIKISGVPIFYKEEYAATWVVSCLEGKRVEDILKILEFMRIMSEVITEHYNQFEGEASVKGSAFERYRLQRRIKMQEKLLELYDEIEEKTPAEKLVLCLKKAGETSNSGRCALYETVSGSVYVRCVSSWMTQEAPWNETEREMYSVQALPDPYSLMKDKDMVVLNSTRVPKEWLDTMNDLYASAAVLMPIEWSGKKGFLCFQEIGEARVWEEEYLWLFTVIEKIIEKVLLKSE